MDYKRRGHQGTNINTPHAHLIDVEWDGGDSERSYDTDIAITARDRSFLLTDVVTVVSQCKAPMESVNAVVNHETLTSRITMTLRVKDVDHLNNVLANIRKVDSVITVERTIH